MTDDLPNVTRRRVLQGSAATLTGAAALGSGSTVQRGEAVVPLVAAGAAVGLSYLVVSQDSHDIGSEGDLTMEEEQQDTHAEIKSRLVSMHAANDSVLTTIENRLQDARNVMWPSVKKEVVKALNNGVTQSTAESRALAPVNEQAKTIQVNLLNRATEVANELRSIWELEETAGVSVIRAELTDQSGTSKTIDQSQNTKFADSADYDYQLATGETYTYTALGTRSASTSNYHRGLFLPRTENDSTKVYAMPYDTGSETLVAEPSRWSNIFDQVDQLVQQMRTNVEDYVAMLYQNNEPGEIDASKYLDATTLASELSSDYESTGYHAYAAAEAAVLGIPGNFETSMRLKLHDAGITVSGSLWTEWSPASTATTTTTTTSGNTTTTGTPSEASSSAFETGTRYDPNNTAKPVYFSFEYSGPELIEGADVYVNESGNWEPKANVTNSSDLEGIGGETVQTGFREMNQPFTVVSATNTKTGEQVENVSLESKNRQTADVTLTEEQMNQLLEYRESLRENDSPGGGGAVLPGGSNEWLVAGGAVGGVTLLGGLAALLQRDN